MIQRLFVYGTLMPGGPNERVLSGIEGSWEPASVTGILLEEGWGAEMGYPGIVLNEHGNEIQGFLLSSEKLSEHWTRLDEFEGKAYERVLTVVNLKDNRTVNAFIYALKVQ
jgi:gamma-glutamylcyclotransferase (GGCT)/AIG2-like uncharacterized protein YtfP